MQPSQSEHSLWQLTLGRAALAALAFLICPARSGAQAVLDLEVEVLPAAPTSDDSVTIVVSGIWRDGCVPRLKQLVRDPGPDLPVPTPADVESFAVEAIVLEPFGGGCVAALTPFHTEISLGHLIPTNHYAGVFLRDTDIDPEADPVLIATPSFTVGPSDPHGLHLQNDRFRATASWITEEATGEGTVVSGRSDSSGLFSFFSPDNWELLVKVLDGCETNGHFWVLLAGATDVAFELEIHDTLTDEDWSYSHPAGERTPSIFDIEAFGGCALP